MDKIPLDGGGQSGDLGSVGDMTSQHSLVGGYSSAALESMTQNMHTQHALAGQPQTSVVSIRFKTTNQCCNYYTCIYSVIFFLFLKFNYVLEENHVKLMK